METATRMGSRSSSRHGPAIQFSGRVRKWSKTWTKSGTSEKLQVFKWLPASGDREDEPEDLPARKYRFLPVDIVHAQARAEKEAQQTAEARGLDTGPEADTATPDAETECANGPNGGAEGAPTEEAGRVPPDEMQVDTMEDVLPVERTGEDGAGTTSGELAGGEEPGTVAAQGGEDADITDAVKDLEGAGEGELEDGGGAKAGAKTEGGDAAGSLEAEGKESVGDARVTRAGTDADSGGGDGKERSAGEIADSLVATGLVEEGDAAKVEARALARVIALDATEQKSDGREADAKDGQGQEAGGRETIAAAIGGAKGEEVGAPAPDKSGGNGEKRVSSKGDGTGESEIVEEGSRAEEMGSDRGGDLQGPEKLIAEGECSGGKKVEIEKVVEGTTHGVVKDALSSGASGAQETERSDPEPEPS